MAEMLTFRGSRSTQFVYYGDNGAVEYPDENYAREIMQLFSIGLFKLNNDGTPSYDSFGNKYLSYTNDDIREYSRAWTGFDWQISVSVELIILLIKLTLVSEGKHRDFFRK